MRCRKDACWKVHAEFPPMLTGKSFRTDTQPIQTPTQLLPHVAAYFPCRFRVAHSNCLQPLAFSSALLGKLSKPLETTASLQSAVGWRLGRAFAHVLHAAETCITSQHRLTICHMECHNTIPNLSGSLLGISKSR